MNSLNRQKGVSLIELLVIIIIIVILASISVIALNGQRAKARDAKRISDIKQVRTALEFYFSDEGEYPIVEQPIVLGQANATKLCSKVEGGFVAAETACNQETTYMTEIPTDPLLDKQYTYIGAQDGYDITFITEKESTLGPAGLYHAHTETINNIPGNN